MQNDKRLSRLAWFGAIGGFLLAVLRIFFGDGNGLINGVGNSSNRIMLDDEVEALTEAIVAYENTPQVSNAELDEAITAVFTKAKTGDPKSALILLKVAQQQRR